jgi:hypothetical protein
MNNLLLFIFIHINSRDELIKQIGILFHAIHLLEVVQAFVKDSSEREIAHTNFSSSSPNY